MSKIDKIIARFKKEEEENPLPECPNCCTNIHVIKCFYGRPGPDLIAYVNAGYGILMGCCMEEKRKIGKCKKCDKFIYE